MFILPASPLLSNPLAVLTVSPYISYAFFFLLSQILMALIVFLSVFQILVFNSVYVLQCAFLQS